MMRTSRLLACGVLVAVGGPAFAQEKAGGPVAETPSELIAVGTKLEKVVQLLGQPGLSAATPSLSRKMLIYSDGTQIVFVNGAAVSATAGGLAEGSPTTGYLVKREGKTVRLDPVLAGGVVFPLPEAGVTLLESYRFVPPAHNLPAPIPFVPYPQLHHGRGLWHTGVGCGSCK